MQRLRIGVLNVFKYESNSIDNQQRERERKLEVHLNSAQVFKTSSSLEKLVPISRVKESGV